MFLDLAQFYLRLLGLRNSTALAALAQVRVVLPVLDDRLELRAEIGAVERVLASPFDEAVRCFCAHGARQHHSIWLKLRRRGPK